MEAFYGHDFSQVRVHTDARATGLARSLSAHAFTTGAHIAFGAGHYRPEGSVGARLLAHELAHVVQQSRGLDGALLRAGIGEACDRYEQEAEQHAERFAHGAGPVASASSVASAGPLRHRPRGPALRRLDGRFVRAEVGAVDEPVIPPLPE